MYKRFDFQLGRRFIADAADVLQRQLTRQHYPLCSHLVQLVGGQIVDDAGLGGDVDVHLRDHPLCLHQHADICYNHCIHAGIPCALQIIAQLLDLAVERQGVAGQIDLDIPGMGIFHCLFHGIKIKICRRGAHPEGSASQIDRIRSVVDRIGQPFKIAHRRQHLRVVVALCRKMFCHNLPPLLFVLPVSFRFP